MSEEDSLLGAWGREGATDHPPWGQSLVPLEPLARALDCLVSTLEGAAGPGLLSVLTSQGPSDWLRSGSILGRPCLSQQRSGGAGCPG